METPVKFAGYHAIETLPIRKGDFVTIPKGTKIRSTRPGNRDLVAGRTYKIRIHSVSPGAQWSEMRPGHKDANEHGVLSTIVNPKVTWAGAGGYWCEADINDIPEAASGR